MEVIAEVFKGNTVDDLIEEPKHQHASCLRLGNAAGKQVIELMFIQIAEGGPVAAGQLVGIDDQTGNGIRPGRGIEDNPSRHG